MSYLESNCPAALPVRNTRFARKAAKVTNQYRAERADTPNRAAPVWGELAGFTAGSLCVGILTSMGAAAIGLPVGGFLGLLFLVATVLAPTLVFLAGRRATVDMPAELNDHVAEAVTAIESLREHDADKAERLMDELIGYAEPARHAVDLDWDTYRQWGLSREPSLLDYVGLGLRNLTTAADEVEKALSRREKYLAASPVAAVLAAIEKITDAAREAERFAVEMNRHAEAPRRELEAQIKVERERERMLELTASFEASMAQATTATQFGSDDIATEARIGREVIRRLDA